jgi:hypothetical protein
MYYDMIEDTLEKGHSTLRVVVNENMINDSPK